MSFALPAALFTAIARTSYAVILGNAGLMLVLALVLLSVFALMALLQHRVFRLDRGPGAVQCLTVAFPNFAAIGLPLLLPIYGPQAGLPVAVAIAVGSVTISPLSLALLEMSRDAGQGGSVARKFLSALRKSVLKPIVVAPLVAVCFSLSDLALPMIADRALGLLGQATAGIGLFLTGLILSAQPIRVDGNVVLGVLLKNVVQPLFAFAIVLLLHLPQPVASEAVLLISIPAGFFGLLFGASYGYRPAVSGSTLVLSSASSIVTLSVALHLLAPH
jgi:malonate transporter